LSTRFRIGLVAVSFSLFDEQMPPGFRSTREELGRRYAELLSRRFEVVYPGLSADEADAARANDVLRAQQLDAVVFAPTMAAPPSYGIRAIEGLEAPVVIWNAVETERLPARLEHDLATSHTTTVGAIMFANPLLRRGRHPLVVTANPGDSEALGRLERVVSGAAAAGSLRGKTCLRVGEWIPGYLDVESSTDDLLRLGLREQAVGAEELDETYGAVGDDEALALLEDLAVLGFERISGPADARSARLALALRRLVARHNAGFGTVNCHGPSFRQSETVGITACLGASLLSRDGVPFSCTGDQPAAVALKLAQMLSGRALYCEAYTPELETGLLLLAAGGEGDPAWADPAEPVTLQPNEYYPGKHGAGTSLVFRLQAGPATLFSLTPSPAGWRLVWATGEIVESRYPELGGPNGMFSFDSGPSGERVSHWIAAGPTHHHALASGRLDVELPVVAKMLGIEHVRV
jgi:L-arabinose isomerase